MKQLQTLQKTGATQDPSSANDTFAMLLQMTMGTQTQATATQPAATTGTTGASAASTDLSALSQALSSGNLSAAQLAFASLQSDAQAVLPHHHRHHHHGGGAQPAASTDATAAAGASTGTAGTTTATSAATQIPAVSGTSVSDGPALKLTGR